MCKTPAEKFTEYALSGYAKYLDWNIFIQMKKKNQEINQFSFIFLDKFLFNQFFLFFLLHSPRKFKTLLFISK
jgi:hypothetical protein